MVNESMDSLPDAPANLAGESVDKGARADIKVSNAAGYLCHIHMEVMAPPCCVVGRIVSGACLTKNAACLFWVPGVIDAACVLSPVLLQVPARGALQDLHQPRWAYPPPGAPLVALPCTYHFATYGPCVTVLSKGACISCSIPAIV